MRQHDESLESQWGADTAEMIFLLNCYDVWSATATDECECGEPEAEVSENAESLGAAALT